MIKVLAVLSLLNVVVLPSSLPVDIDVKVDVNVDGNGMYEKIYDRKTGKSPPKITAAQPWLNENHPQTCTVCVDNQEYCNPQWVPQPNLLRALYGVDIAKTVPLPFTVPDESIRGQIFNAMYRQEGGNMEMYSFITTRGTLICNTKFQATAYETLEDYIKGSSKSTMEKWYLGYEGPKVDAKLKIGPLELGITPPPNSASYDRTDHEGNSDYSRFFNQEGGSISRSSAKCSIYVVDVDIDSQSLSLHENFINAIRIIDNAVGDEKDAQMRAFIYKFGTHYASRSNMGIGTIFETRFTESETYSVDKSVRNECSSSSGGLNLFGFKYGESHKKCTGSLNNTAQGEKTAVQRFRSTTFGSLPTGTASLKDWSSRVLKMMDDKTINPLPTNQVLHPVMNILLTNAVANLTHRDGSKIDHRSLLTTALNGYINYLPSFETANYQFSCADKVRIGHNTYTASETMTFNGRTVYQDDYTQNYLFLDELSLWKVGQKFSGPAVLTSAPCPWRSVGFFGMTDLLLFPDIPNWKICAKKCYKNKHAGCRFWKHDNKTKACLNLRDFEFMTKNSSTYNFTVGSVDCPGKEYKYALGLCPENNPSRSMLKQNGEIDKFLSIDGFDPNAVLIVGHHNTTQNEVFKKGGECYIPPLSQKQTDRLRRTNLILTPGDNKVLNCGHLFPHVGSKRRQHLICLELDIKSREWKQHSSLDVENTTHYGYTQTHVTMEDGVYLFSGDIYLFSGQVYFLPRLSSGWQLIHKPANLGRIFCVVKTSETEFHAFGIGNSFKYDTKTNIWKEVKIPGLLLREHYTCAMIDDSLIVTGGVSWWVVSDQVITGETEVIPFKNGNVVGTPRIVGALNIARSNHGMAVIGGKYPRVMVFGGKYDLTSKRATLSIEVWQPEKKVWKIAPNKMALERYDFGILALRDTMVCP